MNDYSYSIRWAWKGRNETVPRIAEKYTETLNQLGQLNPIFHNWGVGVRSKRGKLVPLNEVAADMSAIVSENIKHDDWNKPDPNAGYSLFAISDVFTSKKFLPHDLSLRFQIGSTRDNQINFEVGGPIGPSDLSVATFPLFKSVLSTVTSIWSPEWANAYAFKMGYDQPGAVAGVPVFPYSRFHIPWMAYLSTPLTEGLVPPPGVQTEQTPDGGLLMITTQDQLDPTNPQHMRLAKAVAELMVKQTGEGSRPPWEPPPA